MSRVFIVQKQGRWARNGEFEPKYDFSSAEEYGEFVYLLSPTARATNPDSVLEELREQLETFAPEDYLLPVGNPCFIGWASALAADQTDGRLRYLVWSARHSQYEVVETTDLYGCGGVADGD